MRVVIVGNGVAGIEAAMTVRARDADCEIAVVSEESDHFFSRTALMYVLSGQLRHRDIEPFERDLYARQRLTRVRARAIGLNTSARHLLLGGGLEPLSYDRLLIACGSRPRLGPWLGSDLPGVGHFVTLQDLAWLESELHGGPGKGGPPPNEDAHGASSTPDSPYQKRAVARTLRGCAPSAPVVIGGGLIGCEVVETMLTAGLTPRFLIKSEWFWPAALDADEAAWVAAHLRGHGVIVELETDVIRLVAGPDGALASVLTNRGEQPCDLAVIAIGVVPNTGWLAASGLERGEDGGILVDEQQRCSAPDVFAAGDCASVTWRDGRRRPEPLWYTGRDQGRVAGRAMLGEDARYRRGVWYNSAKFLDMEYTTVGLVNQGLPGERSWSHEERGAVSSRTRLVTQDGRLVGFNGLGRRWDHAVIIGWIDAGRALPWVLEHLSEASFDTELVPPLRLPVGALDAARAR